MSTTSVCLAPVAVKVPALIFSSPEENHASIVAVGSGFVEIVELQLNLLVA